MASITHAIPQPVAPNPRRTRATLPTRATSHGVTFPVSHTLMPARNSGRAASAAAW